MLTLQALVDSAKASAGEIYYVYSTIILVANECLFIVEAV